MMLTVFKYHSFSNFCSLSVGGVSFSDNPTVSAYEGACALQSWPVLCISESGRCSVTSALVDTPSNRPMITAHSVDIPVGYQHIHDHSGLMKVTAANDWAAGKNKASRDMRKSIFIDENAESKGESLLIWIFFNNNCYNSVMASLKRCKMEIHL